MKTPPWHHPDHYARAVRSWMRRCKGGPKQVESCGWQDNGVRKRFVRRTRSKKKEKVAEEDQAGGEEEVRPGEEKESSSKSFSIIFSKQRKEEQVSKYRRLTKDEQERKLKHLAKARKQH